VGFWPTPVGFCPCGLMSYGLLSVWAFVRIPSQTSRGGGAPVPPPGPLSPLSPPLPSLPSLPFPPRMGQNIKSLAVCVCACVFLRVRTGFWTRISRTRVEIETWYQWTTNSKWLMGNRLVTWSMTSRDLERSRSWPQNVWGPLSREWLDIQPRLTYTTKCL